MEKASDRYEKGENDADKERGKDKKWRKPAIDMRKGRMMQIKRGAKIKSGESQRLI